MKNLILLFVFVTYYPINITAQNVRIKEDAKTITLQNNLVTVSFDKNNADITQIINTNKISLLGNKGRGYLLGPGFSMFPSTYKLLRQTNNLIEISFTTHSSNHFTYDLHYVLKNGVAGIYCFLIQSHKATDSLADYGQTRWGLKADEKLFDYHLVRDSIQGPMPAMGDLKDGVQDWTFKLNDSTYYTKYDYADYIEGRHVHGMAGEKSGLGLFVIQASHEYLNGGPTKQYQNVHATPFMICMFNCGHFLSDARKGDNKIAGEWTKLSGPFLLYTNQGNNIKNIWEDAKTQAVKEIGQWPYQWMDNVNYPLERGGISANLYINGKPAATNTHIVLAADSIDWQAQSKGYIYYGTTNDKGNFNIPHIREGKYSLYAYGSNQTEQFVKKSINIIAGTTNILGRINWQPKNNGQLIWQIGEADRKTTGFNLSNHKRYYDVFKMPPSNLDFTIGKNDPSKDWYYAQTKQGSWKVNFELDKKYIDTATLTIAIAGYARNPILEILVNDKTVATIRAGNDASIYRSAIAGGYYQLKTIQFPSSLLKVGKNTISFNLSSVKVGAGVMYDAIKLEVR